MKAFVQHPSFSGNAPGARDGISMPSNQRYALLFLLLFSLLLGACSKQATTSITLNDDNIQTQSFGFNAAEPNVIRGKNGSIFAIPANAFLDSMGNTITGKVDFRLKEANTDLAIVTGNLITQTGNELLATGGMYQIEAYQNGNALKLNPEIGIQAYLPSKGIKNTEMGLYRGESQESKLDWKLTGQQESEIEQCDRDKASRRHCRKCKNLLRMAKRIKPGKKPKNNYYADRHYWENGKLYFASSGSKKLILSQNQLDECKTYLETSEKGRDLLATVAQYKEQWKDEIGEYYSYKLNNLGWYNIDRLVKEDVFTFNGKVLDSDGNPVSGANVHLYCKDDDLKVHTSTTAEDGNFEMKFVPGREFMLYVYEKGQVGKASYKLNSDAPGQELAAVEVKQMDPEAVGEFLQTLL